MAFSTPSQTGKKFARSLKRLRRAGWTWTLLLIAIFSNSLFAYAQLAADEETAKATIERSSRGTYAEVQEDHLVFDDSNLFVPPDRLPIVDVPVADLLRTPTEAVAEELVTVSVTPDGQVQTGDGPGIEVQNFKSLLKSVREAHAEAAEVPMGDPELEPIPIPESVIGADTRVPVTNTTNYPFRTAGRIDIGCTGTLVGPRHVLTAGHCVYNISNDQWYQNLNFSPGQNGVSTPFGIIPWVRAVTVKGWTQDHDRNYDYAMIILAQNIGHSVGWMDFRDEPSMPLYNININGYPGDKPHGTMWHSFGKLGIAQPFRLYHDADTFGGNSGSAVYVYLQSSGERRVLGIHAYGVDSTGLNGATRINANVDAKLRQWLATY